MKSICPFHLVIPVNNLRKAENFYGEILNWDEWLNVKAKLQQVNIDFIIQPYIRFEGTNGEQGTMFFHDNNGYAVEIKAMKDDSLLFKEF